MESGKDKQQAVIIVKKGGGHAGHHGGAWKVAYADFVTAMMAFFLVMWLVGQSDEVKQGVGGYFRDPVGFAEKAGSGVLKGNAGAVATVKPAPDSETTRREMEQAARNTLKQTGDEIIHELQQVPGFMSMSDRIAVEMVDEGLRVQLMESGDSTFFDLGSASLAPSGKSVLAVIGKAIAALPYDIIVEGHTDSRPFVKTKSYSNWELSSDRANTARHVLEQNGVSPDRLVEIRAFADKRLRFPGRPRDPRNRRIAIIIVNPYSQTDKAPQAPLDSNPLAVQSR